MKSRRQFIKLGTVGSLSLITAQSCSSSQNNDNYERATPTPSKNKPIVISTWNHGQAANKAAWDILKNGGSSLDAVEKGVRVTESDPENMSVGLGGLPDRDGRVTLDACIMNHESNCGAVAFLEHIENPISVARKVMEETPHVMLAGEGALTFALEKGFVKTNLLTDKAKEAWKNWLKDSEYQPVINSENHDTIGMLALDEEGNLAGACTTSGMAYKLNGRIGDSPIIGAGLFVDNEVGAACATGVGEAVVRVAGSAIVVELMRQGKSPQEACEEAVKRIMDKHQNLDNLQVGFLALDKYGNYGSSSVYAGFNMALKDHKNDLLIDANYTLEW
ncbi:isoaspartyl peptidase/L-asparaginase family protein [Crocinitomix algicola]|uniref:isoaspartyl peptidase/L-asparaginase family protein n=1 Tax=Crocinitomix algicola TaxID=1740263 RepID=UPI00087234DD|nr:N(4)-(beta-N-acetylglucosaminyl)-L-asparaginase [Crocinitomix algicola]